MKHWALYLCNCKVVRLHPMNITQNLRKIRVIHFYPYIVTKGRTDRYSYIDLRFVCVCVYVCVRERESESMCDSDRETIQEIKKSERQR
jgi:hypothetical protein